MSFEKKYKDLVNLYNRGLYNEIIIQIDNLENKKIFSPELKNFKGLAYLALEDFKKATLFFKEATDQDDKFFKAFNNYGISLFYDAKYGQAIEKFNKAIEINPEYAETYNNKGNLFDHIGKIDGAIKCFKTAIKLKPDFFDAKENLIKILTSDIEVSDNDNEIIRIHNKLKKYSFDYHPQQKFNIKNIEKVFSECNIIINNYFKELKVSSNQIFRRNTKNLNCERHFKIFNNYKVIPKYCFGCFKVSLEVETVIDLIKLYIVFDNIELPNNNIRKCIIEERKEISGNYKGFIYCDGLEEAKNLKLLIDPIILKTIGNNTNIFIKHGCSEFAIEHPNFKELNKNSKNYMKYNLNWKDKEKIIDNKYSYLKKKIISKSNKGIFLNDILIIKNWFAFAKSKNDESCKFLFPS